jgi:hypothetical protein
MTDKRRNGWVRQLDLSDRHPSEFFLDIEDIETAEPIPPQAHAMRRAWRDMSLDGILCLDNAPLIYFKEVSSVNHDEIRELHRKLWNQGIAPILVVVSPREVYVYSGLALPARQNENVDSNNRLVETFDRVAQALELRQFTRRAELGEFFRTKPQSFNPELRVDRYLLQNLDTAREQLGNTISGRLDPQIVNALLGRTIFTCYLVDRKIINGSYFKSIGAAGTQDVRDILSNYSPRESKRLLYRLFKQLQKDFNGDIFDGDLQAESDQIGDEHITVLGRFLNGDNLGNPQLTLGYWAYDFRVIPIETISGIYELFLNAEDSQGRRDIGAYYTPRFLAEVVLDVALEDCYPLLNKRFLDPACGSGIFLVGIFNQLAEEWSRNNKGKSNNKRAEALIEILKERIFGIDENPIACRIAAFSLYLALLDQLSRRDVRKLQEKGNALPKLVAPPNGQTDRKSGSNLLVANFFNDKLRLPEGGFDLILGNPPWIGASSGESSSAETWCAREKLPIPRRQTAAGFVWKAPRHLKDDGQVCFLLPASLLFGYAQVLTFQQKWMSEYRIEKIINFADMRWYLFQGADHPGILVKYRNERPGKNDYISYFRPKTEVETLQARILVVSPEDKIEVELHEILRDLEQGKAPLFWKQAFWGTHRDRKFLNRLKEYPTIQDRENNRQWLLREGFNRGGAGKPIDRPILREIPFLPTSGATAYVIPRTNTLPEPPVFNPRRMTNEAIFRTPHVLFPHGVSEEGERIKAGFSSFDCSFNQTIRGVHAKEEDEDELRLLACILASPLALYYFFHTSVNWAIERPIIPVIEYKRFPLPACDSEARRNILDQVAVAHRQIEKDIEKNPGRAGLIVQNHSGDIDELVYQYYDVDSWEESLINDTVELWIPSATPKAGDSRIPPALELSQPSHRQAYIVLLLDALNAWAKRSDKRIDGDIVISSGTGLGIVSLSRVSKEASPASPQEENSSEQLDGILERINRFLPDQTRSMRLLRDLKVFDKDKLYLLKPLSRRYWTETAALNDADEIAAAILTAGTREKAYGYNQGRH